MRRSRGNRHTQDVLRPLSGAERTLIEAMTVRRTVLPANRDIVAASEVGAGPCLITGGWAFRYRRTGTGCRQILDFELPGDIIGLQASLLGVMEHSVRSLTPLQLTMLDARLVAEAFPREPNLALRLARYVAAEGCRADELMTVIGCGSAVERIAFLMWNLYRRQSRHVVIDPRDCPFPLRRQHLADALGLTGAHVNRMLNRLKADGIAAIAGRQLAILDVARLSAMAGAAAGEGD